MAVRGLNNALNLSSKPPEYSTAVRQITADAAASEFDGLAREIVKRMRLKVPVSP
jgi:hypothetical protein